MITVEQALEILRRYAPTPPVETVPLTDAPGRYLAEDIRARNAAPRFPASNMDGYATRSGERGHILTVIGEASAGSPFDGRLDDGEAVRIFTGAVVPDSADRVVIREDVKEVDDTIEIRRSTPKDRHIRKTGSDYSVGQALLKKGQYVGAADLSLLASAGLSSLPVRKILNVAILETGDELKPLGHELNEGQIYATNGMMLAALIQSWSATIVNSTIVADSQEAVQSALSKCDTADIIVVIGGASVGRYDLALESATSAGYVQRYAGLAMRPGKPGWFATRGSQSVLGLPGNPASTFVGAYLFLRPLLGLENRSTSITISHDIEENGPRETYLRARLSVANGNLTATALPHQESYRMLPQSDANGLIRVPPMGGPYKAGDRLDVFHLADGPALW